MNKTIKILCLIMAVFMLLPLLFACKKEAEAEDPSSVSTQNSIETNQYGEEAYSDPTAGLDFGGKQINFAVRSEKQYLREWYTENPISNVDQQVHTRNITVEEALNIKIKYNQLVEGTNNEEFNNDIFTAGAAQLGAYDVVSNYAAYAGNTNLMPYYVNWFDSETLPYINLDRAYWNQNYQKDAAVFGKLYINVGDMNLSLYDRCMVVFFNKAKAEQYIKDSSDNPINLYELVQSGQWYYETFYNMTKDVYQDTGDVRDQKDNKDFYGVTGIKGSEASDAFLYSFGGMLSTAAADGTHSLVKDTAYRKLDKIYSAMTKFWYSPDAIMPATSGENYDIFTGGYALFTVDVVWHYDDGLTALHAMSDGYGIIPMPKFDENQENYITGVQDAYNALSVMHCGPDQDFSMISAVLEKMAYESYNTVRPYYVQNILKLRNMDFESSNCFDLVINNIRFDFCDVYFGGSSGIREDLWRTPFKQNASFETRWENFSGSRDKAIKDFDKWLVSQGN